MASAPYAVDDVITYTCQTGWYLVGKTTNTCQGSPTFSWTVVQANVPRCLQGKHKFNSAVCLWEKKLLPGYFKFWNLIFLFFFVFFRRDFGPSFFFIRVFQVPKKWTCKEFS